LSGGKLKSNLQILQVLDPESKVLVPFYGGLNATFSGLFIDVAIK